MNNNVMSNMNKKFMDRFFRQVDGVVWDLMSGRVGISTDDGICTIEGEGDDAQIITNAFEQFGMALPAFAQSTPLDQVKVGDLIYTDKKAKGWIVEIKSPAAAKGKLATKTGVKKFVIMTPTGTRTEWVPPKISMLGFDSGVMVLRSLINMLPGGTGGLSQMQNTMMPLLMMGGDADFESILPMMLFSQMGGTSGTVDNTSANPMAQMMPMLMMMQMMKGNDNGGPRTVRGGKNFFDK